MKSSPATAPARCDTIEVGNVRLAVYERPGADRPLLFLHATGFHAQCWNEVISRLHSHRTIAFDARGHGRSSKPAPPYHWRDFGRDAAELTRVLGLKGAIAIGHSMGGHSAALASTLNPEGFRALVLIEPVILPSDWYKGPAPELSIVRKRRNHWASWDDMYQRFKDRRPFDRWNRKVLLDYCEHGVAPSPNGHGYVLACPPAVEASIYSQCSDPDSNIYDELPKIQLPVTVVRAARFTTHIEDFSSSPTAPDIAKHFPNAKDIHFPDHSHFLPMEAPDLVADLVRDLVKATATQGPPASGLPSSQ